MRRAAAVSATLHLLLLTAVLADWRRPRPTGEVPAQIAIVFGSGAQRSGGAAAAPATARAPAPVPATIPQAAPSRGGVTVAPVAAPMAAPVRLGDGVFGFDTQHDAGLVEAQADPGNRPPPVPEAAFARGEHGRVVLRIHVRPDGRVGDVDTLQSTGFADLDQDARDAARAWRFIPQLRDGEAVASVRDQAFDFVLR